MEKIKVSLKDLQSFMVTVKVLCPNPNSSSNSMTKVEEESSFVEQFYNLVFSLFLYLHQHLKVDGTIITIEEKSKDELVVLFNDLDKLFKENYFDGKKSETWIKSISLLYGISSYYKSLMAVNPLTLSEFSLSYAIETLEITIFERANYEGVMYMEKNRQSFLELKQMRKRRGEK